MLQMILITIIAILCSPLFAIASGSLLFDFESPDEMKFWTIREARQDTMTLSREFATRGKHSALLTTPEWKPGMNEWPVWEVQKLATQDWSGYDRLMIDLVNPSGGAALIRWKAADPEMMKKGSADWPGWSETVPPRSHLRVVIPLDKWIAPLDRSKVTWIQFYTARATPDYRVHVDNVTLLKPGEELPALPKEFIAQIADLRLKRYSFVNARKSLNSALQAVAAIDSNQSVVRDWAKVQLDQLQAALDAAVKEASAGGLKIARIAQIGDEIDLTAKRADRLVSMIAVRQAFAAFSPITEYAVGWESPMTKVLPRDVAVGLTVAKEYSISAARNETESVQIVVIPFDRALKDVRVEVGALTADDGKALPADRVSVRTVGYVKTNPPAYPVDYVGWWPDPLLDFLPAVDVEAGDAQAFWIKVHPPKDQSPGVYHGQVQITPANASPTTLNLSVQVRNFVMPDAAPIPIATQDADDQFFNKYSTENWDTLKLKVSDFLADYYIDFDNIYRHGPPDFDQLRRLRDQGRLKAFSLSTLSYTEFVPNMTEEQYQAAWQKLISEIDPGYEQAKKDGLLQYAYIYGMDEVSPASYPVLKRVTDDVKKRYPEVPIMTTAQDYTCGEASGAESVDVWVPIIHEYKTDLAEKARAKGKKVWWYTCQSPAHPYPNIFTEYPAIEIRLLMGAMSAKFQPDGFLYYCTFRDQGPPRKTVDTGPFTEWDARAFIEPFNGEGYLAYPGVNGSPLASLRLENFRDGLEDLAYWMILRATAEKLRDSGNNLPVEQKDWLRQADQALYVPDAIVKSPHEFSTDPKRLADYRNRLAELIESAGIAPVSPWQ